MSETYNVNMYTFNEGQLEEFLALLRNWKIATEGTRATSLSGRIDYQCTLLRVASLREFDNVALQGNTTNKITFCP